MNSISRRKNLVLERGNFAFVTLTAHVVFLLAACGSPSPAKPVDIAADDLCAFCKQAITDKRYAAEFVTKDGFVRKFDDIACMVQHAGTKVKKDNIEAYFAMDYPSAQWVKADEAYYLRSKRFKTPGGGGILAYKEKARAETTASQYQAEILKLGDVIK